MGQGSDTGQETVPSTEPLDVSRLRHGTEPSRFAIAAIASGLVLGLALFVSLSAVGLLATLVIGLGLAVLMASIWILVQLARVRLLGAAVRVSERSLPELASAIAFVRARVDYRKRVTSTSLPEAGCATDSDEVPSGSESCSSRAMRWRTSHSARDRRN